MAKCSLLFIAGIMLSPMIHANPDTSPESQSFEQCIEKLQLTAEQQGVSSQSQQVLSNARYLEKVIGYDRNQPEFMQTFPDYLNKRVNKWRINKGRALLAKHGDLLNKLNREHGVPAHYLVAFWGLETNYGAYKGKMPIIDSLATLACDERRSAFFTEELLTALKLMDRESLEVEQMLGSWAGAMGHTQFMPSAYIKYARDGDNDGKVDLWNSEADALTSAANFLKHLGWKGGFRWGREVKVPEGFDYGLSGKDQPLALSEWADKGITKPDNTGLGGSHIEASLLVPAGHTGPSFLVYHNFDVIMGWNRSESYALAVGYLADRISGAPALSQKLPTLTRYMVEQIKNLQSHLNQLGIDVGEADGIFGPATRKGVRTFQLKHARVADGFPDPGLFVLLEQAVFELPPA